MQSTLKRARKTDENQAYIHPTHGKRILKTKISAEKIFLCFNMEIFYMLIVYAHRYSIRYSLLLLLMVVYEVFHVLFMRYRTRSSRPWHFCLASNHLQSTSFIAIPSSLTIPINRSRQNTNASSCVRKDIQFMEILTHNPAPKSKRCTPFQLCSRINTIAVEKNNFQL